MRLATIEVETPVGAVERVGAVDPDDTDAADDPIASGDTDDDPLASGGNDEDHLAGARTTEDAIVDLTAARGALLAAEGEPSPVELAHAQLPPDMIALVARGDRGLDAAREALAFAAETDRERGPNGARLRYGSGEYRLLAPLPRPNSLRDCMAIEAHVENTMGADEIPDVWYDQPVYYKGNPDSVVQPGETVDWPAYSDTMDYELEIAAVVGPGGRDVPAEAAADHIFGYTIFNDFSARDAQLSEMQAQLGPAKGKDFANGLGPYLVPAEDVDVLDAQMTARVNGERWSTGSVGEMFHSFPEIVEHVSQSETLYPGDVIGSGTVGEGCGLELGRWLEDGDEIELAVEGIGTLTHRIAT